MGYLTNAQLAELGLGSCGDGVRISDRTVLYNPGNIHFGSNVRVDDFCILSAGQGGIFLGSHIHVAAYCCLIGKGRIEMRNFSGLSSRVSVYSSSDDYSGKYMTNPVIPPEFTGVDHADVFIGEHCIVGAGSVILPGSYLEVGVAVGALSVVQSRLSEFSINSGSPARFRRDRSRELLGLADCYQKSLNGSAPDELE